MIIGSLWIDLHINGAVSLKDKRRIVKSLKDRLKNKFNISIAEIGSLDHWQRAELGIACVGNDRMFIDRTLNLVVQRIVSDPQVMIIDHQMEIV